MSSLRIATFNLESFGEGSGAAAPLPARIAALQPQLLELDADILCLQEVEAEGGAAPENRSLAALDDLLAGTPYASYFRSTSHSVHGSYPADRHNLVILSRYPVELSERVRHDIVPPLHYMPVTALPKPVQAIEARFDRQVLHAVISVPGGQRLHVLNLHLKAPIAAPVPGQKRSALSWNSVQGWAEGFFLAAMKRAGQALEARLVVDRIFDNDPQAMIAVCGDFNAGSWEVPVRILRGAVEETNNSALETRTLTPVENVVSDPRRYSVLHAGRRLMLDHILTSPSLLAVLADVDLRNERLSDEVLTHPESRQPAESFHAPLCAEFDFSRYVSA